MLMNWFRSKIPLAKATTPDQLIAAFFIQSFAHTKLEGWTLHNANNEPYRWDEKWSKPGADFKSLNRVLHHAKKSATLAWQAHEDAFAEEMKRPTRFVVASGGIYVPIDNTDGQRVFDSYIKFKFEYSRAKFAADRALEAMQLNERKWNVAESLLGIKRGDIK